MPHSIPILQRPKEGNEIGFFWSGQFQFQDEIEKLHGVFESQQPVVVQIRR